jgi:hypothetical protein
MGMKQQWWLGVGIFFAGGVERAIGLVCMGWQRTTVENMGWASLYIVRDCLPRTGRELYGRGGRQKGGSRHPVKQ